MDRTTQQADATTIAALRHSELFAALADVTLVRLGARFDRVELARGEVLFREGEPGDALYVVVTGRLSVIARTGSGREETIDTIGPGHVAGELSLLTGAPRSRTLRADEPSDLVVLSRERFEILAERHPEAAEELLARLVPRLRAIEALDLLGRTFGHLPDGGLGRLLGELRWRRLAAGEPLFRAGEEGDSMALVVSGRLEVSARRTDGSDVVLREVRRGETVGELSALVPEPRSASVTAARASHVAEIDREAVERVVSASPGAALGLTRSIVARARDVRAAIGLDARTVSTYALVAGSPGIDLDAVAAKLSGALGGAGSTAVLTAAGLDALTGREGSARTPLDHPLDVTIGGRIAEQERRHRWVLLVGDPAAGPWTDRCLSLADRILVVADAAATAGGSPVLESIVRAGLRTPVELLLFHGDGRIARGRTAPHLGLHPFAAWHHVRPGIAADWSRLARRVTGRAIGLVLGGGGARGMVHLGVFRALRELGIEVDRIGGTSMGAVAGAAFAVDMTDEKMRDLARTMCTPKRIFDYTFPYTSFFKSAKVSRFFREVYGAHLLEDLPRQFFTVSTNLTKAEPCVHETGELWEAVRASMALPGFFSPMLREGDVLVDGMAVDNLPIEPMRERSGGGPVFAVEASPRRERLRNFRFGDSISGWRSLAGRVLPFVRGGERVPSMLAILMRSSEAGSLFRGERAEHRADLVLRPPVETYRTLDFTVWRELIEMGYETALPELSAWKGTHDGKPAPRPTEVVAGVL